MALSLVTKPTVEPLSLVEAKAQCRVDFVDDDALINALITAARMQVENDSQRALCTQTWELNLDRFPCSPDLPIELPKPPAATVTSVKYYDWGGTQQTWSTSLYRTSLPAGPIAMPGRILPNFGTVYPITPPRMDAVTVRYVCGYGGAADVPEPLRAAMRLLIAHWYRNREAVDIGAGNVTKVMPLGYEALVWPFRIVGVAA